MALSSIDISTEYIGLKLSKAHSHNLISALRNLLLKAGS